MQNDFVAWMDARKLGAEEVGERLGISAQTVRNWRSSGIPARRQAHAQKIMEQWDRHQRTADELDHLILRPTEKQFERWNIAAISGPKPRTLKDWAMEGLDALAAQEQHQLRVAEDESPYGETTVRPADVRDAVEKKMQDS